MRGMIGAQLLGNKALKKLKGGRTSASTEDPYIALAKQQAALGKDIALTQGALNRPNQYGPTGSQVWSLRPGADPNNPKPGDWQLTTKLTAPQQGLLDNQQARQQQFGGIAGRMAEQLAGGRDAVQSAVYNNLTRYYGERFGNEEASIRDRLVNQGLDENSAAFRQQIADFLREKNSAYAGAAEQATIAGSSEMANQIANMGNLHAMAAPNMPEYGNFNPVGNWEAPDLLGARATADAARANAASTSAMKSNANKQLLGSVIGGGLMAF